MKVAPGAKRRAAARPQPEPFRSGACTLQIKPAAKPSTTKRDRQIRRPFSGPMRLLPESVVADPPMKFRQKAGKSGSSTGVETHETADDDRCGARSRSGWQPLRRLYPVNTSTLKCVVCFLCHNSKGKAKCAIILMDFGTHRSWGPAIAIRQAAKAFRSRASAPAMSGPSRYK